MNKRTILIITIGVVLTALLIALGLTIFVISKKGTEINALSTDLKDRDARLAQMEKQVESLNAEKSSLAGVKLSLEGKLADLVQDINNAKEKEATLSKKLVSFADEKKKLENTLAETNELMQEKLRLSTEKSQKELTRKSKQYLAQKQEFTNQIADLNQRLKNLNDEKGTLEKNALNAAQVTAKLMKEKEKLDHYKLGLSYENKQEYEAAVKEYEAILEIDPEDANIYLRLASIYIYSIKDPERADFYAKGYAVLNSKKADSGQAMVDQKIALTTKLEEAEQKLIQRDKQRHTQTGNFNELFGSYKEKALKRHYNLAIIYENCGKYNEAAQEYEKVLELDPNDADVHYNLGIVYDDFIQDNEKAVLHYSRYLDLVPNAKDSGIVTQWLEEAREDAEWDRKMR